MASDNGDIYSHDYDNNGESEIRKSKESMEQSREELKGENEAQPQRGRAPKGTKPWDTTSRLERMRKHKEMGHDVSEFVEEKDKFLEKVTITDDEPFVLKPLILNEGPLKGSRILLVERAPRANFFSLPAGLRNIIYEDVLIKDAPIRITTLRGKAVRQEVRYRKAFPKEGSPKVLALPLVNKQMGRETTGMIYHMNSFEFDSTRSLSIFLDGIPGRKQYLRHLSLPRPDLWSVGHFGSKLRVDHLQSITFETEGIFLNALTGMGKVNMRELVQEMLPFLRTWHATNGQARGAKSVLEVVKFEDFRRCRSCWRNRKACQAGGCKHRFVRDRQPGHLQNVRMEFKKQIAESLGLTVPGGPRSN